MAVKDRNVPYAAIEVCLQEAAEKFPDADELKPCWWGGEIFIEVWKAGRADVVKWSGYAI